MAQEEVTAKETELVQLGNQPWKCQEDLWRLCKVPICPSSLAFPPQCCSPSTDPIRTGPNGAQKSCPLREMLTAAVPGGRPSQDGAATCNPCSSWQLWSYHQSEQSPESRAGNGPRLCAAARIDLHALCRASYAFTGGCDRK